MINDTEPDDKDNEKIQPNVLQKTLGNAITDPTKYRGHNSATNQGPWHNTNDEQGRPTATAWPKTRITPSHKRSPQTNATNYNN